MSTVCILIRTAPGNDPEALEMAMALAAFEHKVSLLFQGAGIFWLLNTQEARKPGGKSPAKIINALPMYDCETVYYAEDDLQAFNIPVASINKLAQPLSNPQIPSLLSSAQYCLSF
jgi:tRNA 2-thiouridine synthesizing protein C